MREQFHSAGAQKTARAGLLVILTSAVLALSACGKVESKGGDPAPETPQTKSETPPNNDGTGSKGEPGSSTSGDGGNTQQPDSQESTVNEPQVPSPKPEAPAQKPEEPPKKSEPPQQIPDLPVRKPEVPTQKPEAPAQKPAEPSQKPEAPAQKPEEPSQKPEAPAQKPEEPSKKPEEPAKPVPDVPVRKPEPPKKESKAEEKSAGVYKTPEWVYHAALWRRVKDNRAWTNAVLKVVRQRMKDFEQARDKDDFCPEYSKATRHQREVCWLRLIGGLVKFESSFNPRDSFQEPDGAWSVGLMALSPGECDGASTVKDLQNPITNLTCGVNLMASFIARHGFINGPKRSRGAAAYWSVLRDPYVYGKYKLGRRRLIMRFTRMYRSMPGDPNAVVTKKPEKKNKEEAFVGV